MKILYVCGKEKSAEVYLSLQDMGYEAEVYEEVQGNDDLNEKRASRMAEYVREHRITHIMSIGLIYNCAVAAGWGNVKYVCLIWDSPYLKLYSPYGQMDTCYYSMFDKLDYQNFKEINLPHVLYQPCAVRKSEIIKWHKKNRPGEQFVEDICFVGSLYAHNYYDEKAHLFPPEIHSYFAGIFEEAAFKWDGINRLYGKTSPEMLRYMQILNPEFRLGNPYRVSDIKYFEIAYLARKIANIERICVLNMLAERHKVTLFTYSDENTEELTNVRIMPPVQAGEATAFLFAHSKINLNLSIKGIEAATPQRVMDIMGAGGFVITNYCEETLELFEEDKEIVTFKSPEELEEKVGYYLSHEKERKKIARAGYEKVLSCYTYEQKIPQLLEWVEKS